MSMLADQTPSTRPPISLSGSNPLPIPPKPLFQNLKFKTIGKEPALLMRLSNMATHVDDLDMDDIYEDLPSSEIATQNVPSAVCTRPTLLQTLAGVNPDSDTAPLPASFHSSPSSDISNPFATNASPLAMSHSGRYGGTFSNSTPGPEIAACANSSSNNTQVSDRSDRESRTHHTSSSCHSSPSPNDLVISSSSDRDRVPDPRPALKKVVALKDKFMVVSATACQAQWFAEQALINAQRSDAAAQSCLAAADSFVPCVSDVISAIRTMEPASGPSSEWMAVLRDLEAGLHDLQRWFGRKDAFDRFRGDALGQHFPRFRNIHAVPPSPPGGTMTKASSSAFLPTSVEEEAREAVKAWNQPDQAADCTVDNGAFRREPGFQSDNGVSQESSIHHAERPRVWDRETRKSAIQISEKLAAALHSNLNLEAGGAQQSDEAEAATQRGEVGEGMAVDAATEAAGAKVAREDPPDGQRPEHYQQQTEQTCEKSHHSLGLRGQETMSGAQTNGNLSKKTFVDNPQPGSGTTREKTNRHIQAISNPQGNGSIAPFTVFGWDAHTLAASITESVMHNLSSPKNIHPPSLPSSVSGNVSVTSRNGSVISTTSHAHPSTPIPMVCTNSKAAGSNGERGITVVAQSKIDSKQLRDVTCTSPIKAEPVEPQLSLDKPLTSSTEAVQVKSDVKILLKQEPETLDESEIATRLSHSVSLDDLPAPLADLPSAVKPKQIETDIPSSAKVPVALDSFKGHVAFPRNIANNVIPPAQSTDIPAPPAPVSPDASLASQSIVTTSTPPQPAPAPSLASRVERSTYPNNIQDLDESMGPDLMASGGWDAENDGSRRGRRYPSSRLESIPRSQSRDPESRNHVVAQDSRSVTLHSGSHPVSSNSGSRPSKSPIGRRPISSDGPPASVIGKKRPRDEVRHPGPSRNKRAWTGAGVPSVYENKTSVTPASQIDSSANPHSKRSEPLTTSVYMQYPGPPGLIHRVNPSLESSGEVAHPIEHRFQNSLRSPQSGGYNTSSHDHRNSHHPSYGHHHRQRSYDDDRTPELLTRITGSQGLIRDDSGPSYSNTGRNSQYSRPQGRGRGRVSSGQGSASQQQRRPPSLYDRLQKH